MIRTVTIVALIALNFSAPVAAGEFQLPFCETQEMGGWSFYCRAPEPPLEEEDPIAPATPAPPPAPAEKEVGEATKQMMEFRAMADEIKYKAVLDPTPENVEAYMRVNKLIGDKAGHFTEAWQRILFSTPDLDANTTFPLAEAGIGVYQDQLRIAREANFQKVAHTSGILFMFENNEACGVCRVQADVLVQLQEIYEVSILAVSRDGSKNEAFPDAFVDEGRLEELGLAEYPAPTMALINPTTNEIEVIGSGLLTGEQIMERVYVITEVPVGERY